MPNKQSVDGTRVICVRTEKAHQEPRTIKVQVQENPQIVCGITVHVEDAPEEEREIQVQVQQQVDGTDLDLNH